MSGAQIAGRRRERTQGLGFGREQGLFLTGARLVMLHNELQWSAGTMANWRAAVARPMIKSAAGPAEFARQVRSPPAAKVMDMANTSDGPRGALVTGVVLY